MTFSSWAFLSITTTTTLLGTAFAWQIDSRCPDPQNRRLQEEDAGFDATTNKDHNVAPSHHHLRRNLLATAFQLKMFWQEGYCWQEEWIERKWCMSCQGGTCSSGEHLWLQFCDAGMATQRFNYVPVTNSGGGQIKTATADLCLERVSNHMMKLASCRTTDKQIFVGIKTDGSRFELSPKGSTDMCLVNLEHHPKAQEIIYATSCKLVRTIHTNEWTAYNGGSSGTSPTTGSGNTNLKLRNPECSDNNLCDICEGDCDSDDQCRSDLLCFKRTGNEPVPGCFGTGTVGRDYCYKLPSPVPSIGKNVFEKLRAPGCSRDHPCVMCNGDCENDDECAGNLVCKQKDGPGYVQGCSGYDHSRTDFCVPAST